MSCGSHSFGGGGDCVIDTVRRILEAQRKAAEDLARGCTTSCDRSINDLLAPGKTEPINRNTTVPFMLFNAKDGKPFIGSGFVRKYKHYQCIESPIFKVRGFERNSKYCAKLELLVPTSYSDREEDGVEDKTGYSSCSGGICEMFDDWRFKQLKETGLCITVDLRCFCGITCLDPATPKPFSR